MTILHGLWLCMMANFQNSLIFWLFRVLSSGFFAENNCKWFVKWILRCFLEFYFLTQSESFAWARALAWWPIFKMVSFLGYFTFFFRGFLQRITLKDLYTVFWHVFCNWNFWPEVRILHGLWPLHDGILSKWFYVSNLLYLFERFSIQKNSKWVLERIFT